jgi:hypothetical protein
MNISDPQDSASSAKMSDGSAASMEELQYNVEGLRGLFLLALFGLIAVTLAIDVCVFRRMMVSVRTHLDEQRPRVNKASADFKRITEPLARNFATSLQSFANANHDFQPILDKYRPFLYPYMMAAPSVVPSSPSLKPAQVPPK